jgi:hypothetical protein
MKHFKFNDGIRDYYYDEELPYEPKWWHIVLIISTLVVLGMSIILGIEEAFFKPVTTQGVILSHIVTANRYGEASYHTIARFEDGYIRDLTGLNNYVKPVGTTVTYTEHVLK